MAKFLEAASEGYVDWALYLSSYSPLPALLAIRLYGAGRASLYLGLLFVAMMLPLVHVLADTRQIGSRDLRVSRVTGAAGEVSGYIASYILPLIVLTDLKTTDYVAYAIFIIIVGVVMTRGELLHINPWTYLFGWRLYNVSIGSDDRYYLLARREPAIGAVITAKKIRNRLLVGEAK